MNNYNRIYLIIIASITIYSIFLVYSDLSFVYDKITNFKFELVFFIFPIIFCSWLVLFLRWILLLKTENIKIPLKDNFLIYFGGYALTITPGKTGELIKSLIMKKKFNISRSRTVPIIFLERFYDIIGALVVAILGITTLGTEFIPIIIIASALLLLIFFIIHSKKMFSLLIRFLNRISFFSKFVTPVEDSQNILKKSSLGKIALVSSSLTILYRLIESFAIYLILLGFGIDVIDYIEVVAIYATSIILGNLSLIPGGLGVTEGTLAGLFSFSGIELSTAIVLAIVIRLFTLWSAISFGFVALKISGGLNLDD